MEPQYKKFLSYKKGKNCYKISATVKLSLDFFSDFLIPLLFSVCLMAAAVFGRQQADEHSWQTVLIFGAFFFPFLECPTNNGWPQKRVFFNPLSHSWLSQGRGK